MNLLELTVSVHHGGEGRIDKAAYSGQERKECYQPPKRVLSLRDKTGSTQQWLLDFHTPSVNRPFLSGLPHLGCVHCPRLS